MALTTLKTGLKKSATWNAVRDQKGTTYLSNGVDRAQAWDGMATSLRNWGIKKPAKAPTVALGAAGALTGTYSYYYAWLNNDTSVVSNPGTKSAAISPSAQKVNISAISATAPDSQATHWRLFRNTDGQTTTFYKVADVAAGTTTYTDNTTDASLVSVMGTDHDLPDDQKPYLIFHQGRILRFGSRVENDGTVSVTNGSATVTGTSTYFAASHAGQIFRIDGDTKEYTVDTVASTTSLTLTATYSGTTGSGKTFRIFPGKVRSETEWSKSGEEEYFPAANRTNVYANDGDEPSGAFVLNGTVYYAKRRHIYRHLFQTNPHPITGDGGIFPVLAARGALSQNCIVTVDAEAYLMDERGIYMFDGANEVPIDLAINPSIQPSSEPAADRVNWQQSHKFHGIYDPKLDRVLFFVAMGTDAEPKYAFSYERRLRRWTLEQYRQGITASALLADNKGRLRAWLGDENGLVWALGVSSKAIEGAAPSANGTIRGTATGATSTTLTDTAASFYVTGDGLIGVPIYLYEGTGKGQWRIIKTNTATVLTIDTAWTTTPDTTTKYYVGAIEWALKSKWFPLSGPAEKKRFMRLEVYYVPESADQWLGLKVYYDLSTTVFSDWRRIRERTRGDGLEIPASALTDGELRIHLDEAGGIVEVPLEEHKNWVQFEFRMIETGRKPVLLGYELLSEPLPGTAKRGG